MKNLSINSRQQKADGRREAINFRNRELTKDRYSKPQRGYVYGPCSIVAQVSQAVNAAVDCGRDLKPHSVY